MTRSRWGIIGLLALALLLASGLSRPNTVEANTSMSVNMLVVGDPTVTVAVNPTSGLVGSSVKADLKLTNASNLYGLQVDCTVNPAVLTGQTRTDGTIFTSANSFILDSNPQPNGTWSLSGSLLNPAPAFSGSATAFTLNYKVVGAGDSPINCVAMAVDADGNPVTVSVVNDSFTATIPATATSTPTGTPIPPTSTPTPTAVPPTATPTSTPVPPTSTPVPPTATPITGAISGTVKYEKRGSQAGILVTLLTGGANGASAGQVTTDANGAFQFANVTAGAYAVKMVASGHLSAVYTFTLGAGGITLNAVTLLAGNADDNTVIDLVDAGTIGANYKMPAPPAPASADFNADGLINLVDLVLVGKNFGKTSQTINQPPPTGGGTGPTIANCPVFPADNAWNQVVSSLPVHSNSANYIASINSTKQYLHPDFGSDPTYGIPYVVVSGSQPKVPITFTDYGDESDPGPYPIPPNAPVEGGGTGGDQHVLTIDGDNCKLYELYNASKNNQGGWDASSGAVFNLLSNALRPAGWTSADAAGLPIFPGLVRYDEIQAGVINHALRFTVHDSQRAYILPATHFASSSTNANLPPMGLRVRLKANFDISGYTGASKVILQALKTYGMIVADNGSSWFISGATDSRWNDDDLNQLKGVPGSAFEAVNTGNLVTQ